jgi:hypothetical protein
MFATIKNWFEPTMPAEYLQGIKEAQLQKAVDEAAITAGVSEIVKTAFQTVIQKNQVRELNSAPEAVDAFIDSLGKTPFTHRHEAPTPVVVLNPEPKIMLNDGLGANAIFNQLMETCHPLEWNQHWGRVGRGYKGLLKSSPMPGMWATWSTEEGIPIIFHADNKGVLCIVYQHENKILWSAPEEVKVTFQGLELHSGDMAKFADKSYLVN